MTRHTSWQNKSCYCHRCHKSRSNGEKSIKWLTIFPFTFFCRRSARTGHLCAAYRLADQTGKRIQTYYTQFPYYRRWQHLAVLVNYNMLIGSNVRLCRRRRCPPRHHIRIFEEPLLVIDGIVCNSIHSRPANCQPYSVRSMEHSNFRHGRPSNWYLMAIKLELDLLE